MLRTAAVLLALAVPLLAAPVPKGMKKLAPNGIIGQWVSRPGGTTGWVFRHDGTGEAGELDNPACKALIKLDPTQSPMHIDWSQDGGKTWHLGIYEIEDDVIRMNFRQDGTRPTEIGPNEGSQFETATRKK